MKKFLRCILIGVLLVTLLGIVTGCGKKNDEAPEQTTGGEGANNETSNNTPSDSSEGSPKKEPITCQIKFAKEVNSRYEPIEYYEVNKFPINTKIYVLVDFTMINYSNEEDYIEFKIQIPNAKYYSTYEYNKGVIKPKEEEKEVIDNDGNKGTMIELSDMVFRVREGQVPFHYTYCFSIMANSKCDNAEFRVVFISDNGNVISRNKTFSKKYSFFDANEENSEA